MFVQEITPDTSFYMLLAYAVLAVLSSGYVISLITRSRNLQRQAETIARMQVENNEQGLS